MKKFIVTSEYPWLRNPKIIYADEIQLKTSPFYNTLKLYQLIPRKFLGFFVLTKKVCIGKLDGVLCVKETEEENI